MKSEALTFVYSEVCRRLTIGWRMSRCEYVLNDTESLGIIIEFFAVFSGKETKVSLRKLREKEIEGERF